MDIIVEDRTMGYSRVFKPTAEGYRQANAMLKSIVEQGHDPGQSDIARIKSFVRDDSY